jgi:hypothetical protein
MKQVRIVESDRHAPHRRPEETAALMGKVGQLTGRTLGDLVEVRVLSSLTGKPFGYLFHPSEVVEL